MQHSNQQLICSEVDSAVCLRQMLLHGPDTVECFAESSMIVILGYTYAGMVQVSQTNARPLGYTGMAKISLNEL